MFPPERQEGRAVFRRRMSRFQEEANVGVEVLVILVVILLFFGGGGWYVSRPGYRWGGESWLPLGRRVLAWDSPVSGGADRADEVARGTLAPDL